MLRFVFVGVVCVCLLVLCVFGDVVVCLFLGPLVCLPVVACVLVVL